MTVSWPGTLPGISKTGDNSQESATDRLLFHKTTSGPGKLRARYTSGSARITIPMVMTLTEVTALMDFYEDTLQGGALPFDWSHPRTGSAQRYRFQPGVQPTVVRIIPGRFRVQLALEAIPGA